MKQQKASVRSSYSSNGAFYGGDGSDDRNTSRILERVEEIAEKRKWPMSHVGLAWLNQRVTAPIVGFSSVDRIEEALAATGKVLTDEEERYLEELYVPQDVQGHS